MDDTTVSNFYNSDKSQIEYPVVSLPKLDGYTMPAEWNLHERCWMLWPYRTDVWRNHAKNGQETFAQVANTIAQFEPVVMGVLPQHVYEAKKLLSKDITVLELKYNDSWMRDIGPTFVMNKAGTSRIIDWQFNAWGGLYTDYFFDLQVPTTIAHKLGVSKYFADIVMEGGALHTDGEGTILVVEENLLNPNRNPHLDKKAIESKLCHYLNAEKVIWIPFGVYLDETGGHIDNMCCFVRPGVIALTWTDDVHDPQYERSMIAYKMLSSITDAKGRKFEIHKIHQPNPMTITSDEAKTILTKEGSYAREAGHRLAASYINYYVANGGVIVPQFEDKYDMPALETIQMLYPDRKVVGIPAREILLGGGNIHCITQQQPKASPYSASHNPLS